MKSNNNKKDTKQRGWGALSAKEGARGNLSTSHLGKSGVAAHIQQSGAGKLIKVAVGGKLHRRGGRTHFPREL
jgi:hypothetical protein